MRCSLSTAVLTSVAFTFLNVCSLFAQAPPISDFQALVELLDRDSVTHQTEMEEQYVLIPTEKGGMDSVFVIRWAADDGVVHFLHQIPVKLPEQSIKSVEAAMIRLNHAIPVPGLGVNHDSQAMYFRMTVPFKPRGGLTPEEVRAYFSYTLEQSEQWRPVLEAVIKGEAPAEAIVEYHNNKHAKAEPQEFPGGELNREFANSKWEIVFTDEQKLTLSRDGNVAVQSTFELKGNRIRFSDVSGPMSVKGPGIYEWAIADGQFTFKKIEDESEGRSALLTSGPWIASQE